MALLDSLAGKGPAPIDGLTAQQRFFLGFANVWCQNRTDQISRYLANIDPHSPGKWRVNGTVSNMGGKPLGVTAPVQLVSECCKFGVSPNRGNDRHVGKPRV